MAILKNTSITDGGFIRLPRASTAGRLASPGSGNLYYDTSYASVNDTQGIFFYNSAVWVDLLRSQSTHGLYYNEGSTAPTTYWNNAATTTMDSFGELGLCTGHGWVSGPADFIFTLPGLPYHTSLRYRACVHLVDSLDNETSYLDLTNSAGTYERYFTWTSAYNAAPTLSFTKAGASATWSGGKFYTDSPWPGPGGFEGYYILDSGQYEHTADSFSARHRLGADQPKADEAQYITHVQLYLYN